MSKKIMLTAAMASLLGAGAVMAQDKPANDWPTWGYDQERSAWNRGETTLSKANVGKLKMQWTAELGVPTDNMVLSTMTSPVIAGSVQTATGAKDILYVLGANDTLYAVDATSGQKLWEKSYPNPVKPTKPVTWLCSNTTNTTPTIDKARGLVFFVPSDGKLRAVSLADGSEKMAPVEFVAPFARAWSLNLVDEIIYTTSGRACGEIQDPKSPMGAAAISGLVRKSTGPLLDASAVQAADTRNLANVTVTRFYTSGARPAAPWGRGSTAMGPDGSIYLETSNGLYDPAAGNFSESILRMSPHAARLMDSFTPKTYKHNLAKDLSGSASPVVFSFKGRTLVAATQKEAVLRILDATKLGGEDHMTPLWESSKLGNDQETGTDPGRGVWGAVTTFESPDGRRFLYIPMLGNPSKDAPVFPVTNGAIPNGSIMAFEVLEKDGKITAEPRWTSTDMVMPDPPVVANGVLYAIQSAGQAMQNMAKPGDKRMTYDVSAILRSTPVANLRLFAYDAVTGKPLYDSKQVMKGWVHFSEPVVALGKVFVVTHDAKVHAFGVKK